MRIELLIRRLGAVALTMALGAVLVGAGGASAAPVPPSAFTCGITDFTPCNQTAHFSDINMVGTPFSSAPSCPAFVTTDFVTIVATGNGVEHSIINNAGDGWFTTTFTGDATLTAYPPSSVDVTDPNNPVITGPSDPNVAPFVGKITYWFGGSFNKNNQVFHDTFHFSGAAADGTTLRVLDVSHSNTTPNTDLGPPHSFEITRC